MDASEAAHVREMMVGMTVGTVRITEIIIKKTRPCKAVFWIKYMKLLLEMNQ